MGKARIKPNYRRRVLRLPDLDHCKVAVLNSLGSQASRRVYEYAIDQFISWYCSEPRLAFNRIVVVRYRMYLESRHLAANTINQQLAAVSPSGSRSRRRGLTEKGKVWGRGISQNVVWYVVKTCCERAGLEHIAPHDLRRTCAKLCHDSGGELEQIQFLLGHVSVQTTERYLGCKQNLGSPVNDRFQLRTDVQPPDMNCDSAAVKRSTPVETASREGIQCRRGGREDEQTIERKCLSLPEPTDMVEVRKGHRPHSLRRCSGAGASRSDSGSQAHGQPDSAIVGPVGPGTLPDPTP